MAQQIASIIEDFRVLDGGVFVEDAQTVTLPNITHPTNTLAGTGMAGEIDVPDGTQVSAMSFSIAHNCGRNCEKLTTPGVHNIELRTSKQVFDKESGQTLHKSVKHRMRGLFVGEDKGTIQRKNPNGRTANFSCLRYEEEVDGQIITLVDIPNNILKVNGVDYSSRVRSLLE